MTKNVPNVPKIALIAYDGVQMSAVLGLCDLFDVANQQVEGASPVQIAYDVLTPAELTRAQMYDAVILPPNLTGARGHTETAQHAWITEQHRNGAMLCSACAGAFWLGHAGVLDGRPATTHWALEQEFQAAFPTVALHPEHILLDDNDVVTAGGVMAWTDLGLHLVRKWLGAGAVSRTCRQMLIDPTGREQRNYRAFQPTLNHTDIVIRDLQLWMEGHVQADLSVIELAQRAAMSVRSFQRRFRAATGHPVHHYVQELRIERAKGLLERTSQSVSDVCWQVGYQDVSAFSRLFKTSSGLSPRDYRKRFQII